MVAVGEGWGELFNGLSLWPNTDMIFGWVSTLRVRRPAFLHYSAFLLAI